MHMCVPYMLCVLSSGWMYIVCVFYLYWMCCVCNVCLMCIWCIVYMVYACCMCVICMCCICVCMLCCVCCVLNVCVMHMLYVCFVCIVCICIIGNVELLSYVHPFCWTCCSLPMSLFSFGLLEPHFFSYLWVVHKMSGLQIHHSSANNCWLSVSLSAILHAQRSPCRLHPLPVITHQSALSHGVVN